MLQSVVSPMVAATNLKSMAENKPQTDKDFKGKGSEASFGKALEDKLSIKAQPKETKDSSRAEAPERKPEGGSKKKDSEVVRAEEKAPRKMTSRQQAIQEFMDSFESEFEISPTRLVEAMAELKDSQLTQSPEETAEAVIQQLDLPQEDAEKAQAMYAGLLAQLNQMPVPPKAPPMMGSAPLSNQGVQDRVLAAQTRQDMTLKSVDQLNQKFWANPKVTGGAENPQALTGLNTPTKGLQNLQIDEELLTPEAPMQNPNLAAGAQPPAAESLLDKLPPHLRGQMSETMSPALLAALAAKQAAAQQAQSEEGDESSLPAEFQQAALAPKMEMPAGNAAIAAPMKDMGSADQFSSGNQPSWMQQNSSGSSKQDAQVRTEGGDKTTVKKADFQQSLTGLEGIHGAPIKGETLTPTMGMPVAAAPGAAAPADPAENEAAVKQLMNQAQYLVKKGGGEMKVQMTPEGMGTIHLKVMLQDGKVNMQMSAETQDAKKVIESSLAELKTSLAAHKLSMENVKVDVVNSTSADTAMQNQTNLNSQQQQRDQTRQFWNQFNDNFGSQGRKESFLEMQGTRGYGAKRDPLQPIDTDTKSSSRKVEGKGSGLNLVA